MNLPVTLLVGATAQTVDVTAESTSVDLSAPTTIINTLAIENLPINGRRFTDFAALTPTVQIDPIRGSISFAGQRGINGNVMVDGADYNNPFFGGTRGGERSGYVPTIPQASIAEFQAITTGYAAEYGRSTGGVLNAISKSGTNEVHGEAFYQMRPRRGSDENPFIPTIRATRRNARSARHAKSFSSSAAAPAAPSRRTSSSGLPQRSASSPRCPARFSSRPSPAERQPLKLRKPSASIKANRDPSAPPMTPRRLRAAWTIR